MSKPIAIVGRCGAHRSTAASEALVRYVSETQPDELVLFEQSDGLLRLIREVYDGTHRVHADNPSARYAVAGLPESYGIAPGWISTTMRDGYEASGIAGNTAQHAGMAFGTNVVLGYMARLGLGSYSRGRKGELP